MNIKGFSINRNLWYDLRTCQQESIKKALSYLKKPLTETDKSCLVSLPTGAGKSGVISVISHKSSQKKVLVLCHRRAVCDQLHSEINGKFFSERAEGSSITLKHAFDDINDLSKNGIYVSTFQKLQNLNSIELEKLKKEIDLIIIDEGHSEPSPVWRTLVRGMNAHKIVITATPYRNDLFQFDVSADFSYIYTFKKALLDNVLKEPEFESIKPQSLSNSIRSFLTKNPNTKCIIKCKNISDIESYYNQLNSDFNILAIHDQLKQDPRSNVKSAVPANLKNSQYEVIIHQRKLDEGVDIPQAKLLILTYNVNSGRELVQTIGRVVRIFSEVEPKVIEINSNSNHQMWQNYRLFDASLNSESAVKKFILSLDANRLIELYLEAFPDSSYYGNRFLRKFELNEFDPETSLNIPTASVCFLNTTEGFSVELLSDILYWRCNNNGELAKQFNTQFGIYIIVSIAFNRSKFLKEHFFFEPSLEITIFKELSNNIVAIYDSRGRRLSRDKELKLGSAVPQENLFKILSLGESSTTKEASSKSVSSARRRPDSIAIKGQNLDQMADQQANSSYRLSTARLDTYDGMQTKSGSYYVGVDSGRISDQKENSFSLHELNDWLETMDTVLAGDLLVNNPLIDSYAKPVNVDTNINIESVIFDFSEFESPITISINGSSHTIDNDFLHRNYENGFLLLSGIEESRVVIELHNEEPCLDMNTDQPIFYSLNEHDFKKENIVEFLAEHLHKALLENGIGYSQDKFYQTKLPVEHSFNFDESNLANVVIGFPELLGKNLDEKGYRDGVYQVVNQNFSTESIFHLLDKIKANGMGNPTREDLGPFSPYIPNADLVLNTDMGTEPADFILSSKSKLVYVHIKCGNSFSRPNSSAGALAEVGSQAIKNMEMLVSGNELLKPGNWNLLLSAWPTAGAEQLMHERIRLINGQPYTASNSQDRQQKLNEAWEVVFQRRRSTAVRKEIWIVAANSFSVRHFKSQLWLGKNAASETLQAYQLINSWISTAHSNDVELKIFVAP
ncbi:DEAD/DEAH box helicase [Chromohalobacter sarecensis]|uniref:DEAD/DEAH box helicase n=1 Tax=Chromohalobacter sarecensis TaxID=245294 RepID=A0ABV9D0N4_9GAMM|nr:DEAD/DEAH box helicase family protein [Chromohalobacter sarecensis]